jgi:hypothetical protein
MDANGKTHDDAADGIGVSRDHLRNAIYRKSKRLGLDALQRASALFGRPITEFVEDPGAFRRGGVWPQRKKFRELAESRLALGISKEQQAAAIGIEASSFVTYYSGKGREPGKRTLKSMADYYKVPLSELMDDGSGPGKTWSASVGHFRPDSREAYGVAFGR